MIRSHSRWKRPLRLAAAGALLACAWLVGSAVAQQGRADLFGALPEAPTEQAPPPVHDPSNADLARLQPPREAFSALPGDARGKPDWMRALREGTIRPRADVAGRAAPPQLFDLDVVMKNTAQMPHVKFPHSSHSMWLECSNCHDKIFVPKAGANPTSMAQILQGESCGVCHTTVAFTAMYSCERCHNVLQPGQKPWW